MKISEHAYAVTGFGYVPPWEVNAGFVTGDSRTLIVDAGPGRFAAQTLYGYARAVRERNALFVVNTERHLDHVAGNGYFRSMGVELYGHPSINRRQEDLEADIEEMNAAVPDPFRRGRREAALFFRGTALANPDRFIDRDTDMDLGDCPVHILMTPGHTASNLSVFVPSDGVLFSGDCVVADYFPNLGDSSSDWRMWLDSLDHIEALRPDILVPGHGDVLTGGRVRDGIERMRVILEKSIEKGAPAWDAA
ncbi:MBL fold metallo-hydrolase [bacterium]|nr:MBL fold metallo-hydrolase [bacterium]